MSTGAKKWQALGRLPKGRMNKTETAYAAQLELRKSAGEVAWYRFEGVKLRLAESTFLTVDFAVMLSDGQLQMHECKGSKSIFTDDARVKMKVAAEAYPFLFLVVYPRSKRDGGGWLVEEL